MEFLFIFWCEILLYCRKCKTRLISYFHFTFLKLDCEPHCARLSCRIIRRDSYKEIKCSSFLPLRSSSMCKDSRCFQKLWDTFKVWLASTNFVCTRWKPTTQLLHTQALRGTEPTCKLVQISEETQTSSSFEHTISTKLSNKSNCTGDRHPKNGYTSGGWGN